MNENGGTRRSRGTDGSNPVPSTSESTNQATVDKEDESDVMAYCARSHANEKTVRAPADQDVDAGALLARIPRFIAGSGSRRIER